MNKKLKIYAYLWKLFADEVFSIREFEQAFYAPNARKTLCDLCKEGFVIRVGRGHYKAAKPVEFLNNLICQKNPYDLPNKSNLPYAFADKDAVVIWSNGYYWTGFKAGFLPIIIEVRQRDLKKWQEFFKKNRAEYFVEGEKPKETFVGTVYILRPVKEVEAEKRGAYSVMPLKKTIEFCKRNKYLFEPVLEYLSKKYRMRLAKQYSYINR